MYSTLHTYRREKQACRPLPRTSSTTSRPRRPRPPLPQPRPWLFGGAAANTEMLKRKMTAASELVVEGGGRGEDMPDLLPWLFQKCPRRGEEEGLQRYPLRRPRPQCPTRSPASWQSKAAEYYASITWHSSGCPVVTAGASHPAPPIPSKCRRSRGVLGGLF